jgi:2-(1,2-epoxy-1,2-dihydrophenyl)acetyl-CoA isomerase
MIEDAGTGGAGQPGDGEPGRMEGAVRLRIEADIAWITLDRPARLNAFAGPMRDELVESLETAAADASVRVIVITGAGRAFSSGADVHVMADLVERRDEAAFGRFVESGTRVVRAIRAARQPVIAGVNGVAVGAGAALASACDLRVLSDSASIGFTFNRIGLHPDWGATHFLPRLVGYGRATELILSGRMFAADEAERIGFAQRVFPAPAFAEDLAALAAELAAKPPLALEHVKRTLGLADAGLDAALRREAEAQTSCFRSDDVREGISAFLEKRPPRFSGR